MLEIRNGPVSFPAERAGGTAGAGPRRRRRLHSSERTAGTPRRPAPPPYKRRRRGPRGAVPRSARPAPPGGHAPPARAAPRGRARSCAAGRERRVPPATPGTPPPSLLSLPPGGTERGRGRSRRGTGGDSAAQHSCLRARSLPSALLRAPLPNYRRPRRCCGPGHPQRGRELPAQSPPGGLPGAGGGCRRAEAGAQCRGRGAAAPGTPLPPAPPKINFCHVISLKQRSGPALPRCDRRDGGLGAGSRFPAPPPFLLGSSGLGFFLLLFFFLFGRGWRAGAEVKRR